MAFRIMRHDITKVKADAIVNTANPKVAVGTGVDYAIYEAAGAERLLLARKEIGHLEIGEVGITPAFDLDAKYIIHSSGPYWIDGLHGEEQLLRRCYDKALELAYKYECKSIAFPLMSTGSYGFSKELGLRIALEAFNAFLLQHDMEIILVVFGENALRLSGKIFDDVREYVDNSYVNHKLQKEYCCNRISGYERRDGCGTAILPRELHEENTAYMVATSPLCQQSDFYMPDEVGSFGGYLQQLINKKGMKNSQVYTAANLTKQYFSKLIKGKVTPSKTKILSLAIALHLNMDETIDFLGMSGYAFTPFSKVDKIFEYFISKKIYDIYQIDIVLFDYGLPTLANE